MVFDMLMAGVDAITEGHAEVCMHVDGLATPIVLADYTAKSPTMQFIHVKFMELQCFRRFKDCLAVAHIYGEGNPFADAASRGYFSLLDDMARLVGVAAKRVDLPEMATALVSHTYAFFMAHQAMEADVGCVPRVVSRRRRTHRRRSMQSPVGFPCDDEPHETAPRAARRRQVVHWPLA